MAKQSLRTIMAGVAPAKGGHPCLTCDALSVLTGDDRAALLEWLASKHVSTRMIHEALGAYGIRVTPASVARHRREHSVE